MAVIFQICIEGNTGSTGRIAEAIGRLAIYQGWASYIAYGRNKRSSKSELIKIGEYDRIEGNGVFYTEGDLNNLCKVLKSLISTEKRRILGSAGREKMINSYSWNSLAKDIERDYKECFALN